MNRFLKYTIHPVSPVLPAPKESKVSSKQGVISASFRAQEFGLSFKWCGGVVVIRSPHDPEVPSSNPGKNNTSDFSIRDPLSLPSCDWYRIYLTMWWNSSVGRAADLIYTCQVRCHGFDSRCFPHI